VAIHSLTCRMDTLVVRRSVNNITIGQQRA